MSLTSLYEKTLQEAREMAQRKSISEADQKELDEKVRWLESAKPKVEEEAAIAKALGDLPRGPFGDEYPYGGSPVGGGGGLYGGPGSFTHTDGLYGALKANGYHGRKGQEPVYAPVSALYSTKSDLIATEGDANPRRIPLVPMGRDSRYIFPTLNTQGLAVGETRIDYLAQTTRTLPDVATVSLAIDSASEKAIVDSVATLQTKAPRWHAVVSNPQPLALFAHPDLRTMLNGDMSQSIRNSLDADVIAEVDGFSGQLTLSQSTDTVLDFLKRAKGDLEATGFQANALWMNPGDAENLDLQKDSNERYMLSEGSGIWGLSRVATTAIPAGTVYVLDTNAVQLYASPLLAEVDFSKHFTTNRAILRIEMVAATIVKNGNATLKGTLA